MNKASSSPSPTIESIVKVSDQDINTLILKLLSTVLTPVKLIRNNGYKSTAIKECFILNVDFLTDQETNEHKLARHIAMKASHTVWA